jgi:hypothetical protein
VAMARQGRVHRYPSNGVDKLSTTSSRPRYQPTALAIRTSIDGMPRVTDLSPDDEDAVRAVLERHCGIRAVEVTPLAARGRRRVLRIARPDALPVVLRVYAQADGDQDPAAHATTLAWLETRGYQAPRVHRTITGDAIVDAGASQWLLVDFVAGAQAGFTPVDFAAIAHALGKLHLLEADAELPMSTFQPANAEPTAAMQLAGQRVPGVE